jgi:quinol monooxygenase YgiN
MRQLGVFVILSVTLCGARAQADAGPGEVAVLTYLRLKPGTAARFQAALDKIVKPSIAEPGNVAWYVQRSADDPASIVFYTRWKDETALQTHLHSPPLVAYIAETAPMLEAGYPKLVRYHPIDQARDLPDPGDDCNECP